MTTRILVAAIRSTGTQPAKHSIVDLGAVWLTGGVDEDLFSQKCSAFDGAVFSDRISELTGITEGMATDPYCPDEGQVVAKFVHWAGAKNEPVILAGLRPGMVRAFVLAAVRRNQSSLHPGELPKFHPRCLDMHSLFVRYCMANGVPVPSRGFHPSEMFAHFDLQPSSFSMDAVDSAELQCELIKKLI
ncbi:MAG: hypothetical protein QM496_13915 [Verrucomicrobiota bacterium]